MQTNRAGDKSGRKGVRFVTEYVHYWTKKRMKASDYGYKAWPFGGRKK